VLLRRQLPPLPHKLLQHHRQLLPLLPADGHCSRHLAPVAGRHCIAQLLTRGQVDEARGSI
jgi:hypothetical protein